MTRIKNQIIKLDTKHYTCVYNYKLIPKSMALNVLETVTDCVSAGRFVAEPIKCVWSCDFDHKNLIYYSVTRDYCCISAITNNHSGICGFA